MSPRTFGNGTHRLIAIELSFVSEPYRSHLGVFNLQEILEEVRKELQKVKEEIIGGRTISASRRNHSPRTLFPFCYIRTWNRSAFCVIDHQKCVHNCAAQGKSIHNFEK